MLSFSLVCHNHHLITYRVHKHHLLPVLAVEQGVIIRKSSI